VLKNENSELRKSNDNLKSELESSKNKLGRYKDQAKLNNSFIDVKESEERKAEAEKV
jgi:hypothetical protein